MYSVSQPRNRFQFEGSPIVENSILKDLDSDKEFYSIKKQYQNAELNDSHMNMSLSVVSDQTEIENRFQQPVGIAEKYGFGGPELRNRNFQKAEPKSILKNSHLGGGRVN